MTNEDYENMKIFGKWIDGARTSYKGNNNLGIGIMKNQEARKLYENFINKYNIRTELQEWEDMHAKIISDTNNGILYVARDKPYQWLKNNKTKYDANDNTGIIHKYTGLRDKFKLLLDNYPQLFIDHNKVNEDTWINNLTKLRQYMDVDDNKDKKLPSQFAYVENRTDIQKQQRDLRNWYDKQKKAYGKSPEKSKYRLKDKKYWDLWTKFLQDYKDYI